MQHATKHFNITWLLLLFMSMMSGTASAYDAKIDGIYYTFNTSNNTAEVTYHSTSYNSYSGDVTIPETVTYNGKPYAVKSIGSSAFLDCHELTAVTIPNSVTSIGGFAFYGCRGLTSITIPNSVTSIGWEAFYNCSGLTSVNIPNSVTSIGDYAFSGCSGLTSITVEEGNSVFDSRDECNAIIETSSNTLVVGCQNTTILNGVTSIGAGAFSGRIGLTSITIPNSVTSIGRSAFYGCSGLTAVTIPNGVTSIGEYAFSGCSGLTSITIPSSVTSIGGGAFRYCSGLTSVTIPNGVTSIGGYAFYECSGLTSVTIPNSVTSIGEYAFSGCSGLTAVTIPNSVTSIGGYAFKDCSGLTSVTIPNSVTSIGEYAFSGCSGLTAVTIPNSVTSIGGYAFSGCSGLTAVTIPNGVTSIGGSAFSGCSGLTAVTLNSNSLVSKNNSYSSSISNIFGSQVKEYILGEEVTSIGERAFYECSGLTSVTIPNSVTSIGGFAFASCSGLTSVTIPNSVTSIGGCAFEGCSGLTAITIPNSVTSIGSWAFEGCSGLTSVRIGNNVTEIPGGAFENCTNLTSVVIGDGVYKINYQAFRGDKNLESIISVSPTPPIISSTINYDNPFETITYKHAILKVPLECKSRYWSADYWKDFAYIEEMDMTAYREGVDMEEGDKAAQYATFYDSQSAYTLPAGLKASVVTGMSSGKLVYKVIAEGGKSNNVVPKGVAVMLTSAQEDASAYTLTPTESDVTYTGTNWLYGSDEATTTTASGNCRFYKLSYGASDTDKSEVFGWYWGAANGGAFSIAGHKAWLAVPMVAGAPTRSFSMEGDATDIVDIETTKMQNEDEGYYDLQGRRVTEPVSRGIYIHKGKKIIIR